MLSRIATGRTHSSTPVSPPQRFSIFLPYLFYHSNVPHPPLVSPPSIICIGLVVILIFVVEVDSSDFLSLQISLLQEITSTPGRSSILRNFPDRTFCTRTKVFVTKDRPCWTKDRPRDTFSGTYRYIQVLTGIIRNFPDSFANVPGSFTNLLQSVN